MSRSGIVNVRMVITEEKILSNIDRVEKLINPNAKKQIIQLEEDAFFKDLIESIKTYLVEYPKKKNFPASVYKASYALVEYATNQFESTTKQIEELVSQREVNLKLAETLKNVLEIAENKEENWKAAVSEIADSFAEEITDTLGVIGRNKTKTSQAYQDAVKLINARVSNLETNLHIEIDMERIEDRSKALSYIGIEIADALKLIPAPEDLDIANITETVQEAVQENEVQTEENVAAIVQNQEDEIANDIGIELKPTLWQKFKNSKLVRAISYVASIRIKIERPLSLPEGRGE